MKKKLLNKKIIFSIIYLILCSTILIVTISAYNSYSQYIEISLSNVNSFKIFSKFPSTLIGGIFVVIPLFIIEIILTKIYFKVNSIRSSRIEGRLLIVSFLCVLFIVTFECLPFVFPILVVLLVLFNKEQSKEKFSKVLKILEIVFLALIIVLGFSFNIYLYKDYSKWLEQKRINKLTSVMPNCGSLIDASDNYLYCNNDAMSVKVLNGALFPLGPVDMIGLGISKIDISTMQDKYFTNFYKSSVTEGMIYVPSNIENRIYYFEPIMQSINYNIYELDTNSGKAIKMGNTYYPRIINEYGHKLYVTSNFSNRIDIINMKTNKMEESIKIDENIGNTNISGIAYVEYADDNYIYIFAICDWEGPSTIYLKYDIKTKKITKIDVRTDGYPDGSTGYLSYYDNKNFEYKKLYDNSNNYLFGDIRYVLTSKNELYYYNHKNIENSIKIDATKVKAYKDGNRLYFTSYDEKKSNYKLYYIDVLVDPGKVNYILDLDINCENQLTFKNGKVYYLYTNEPYSQTYKLYVIDLNTKKLNKVTDLDVWVSDNPLNLKKSYIIKNNYIYLIGKNQIIYRVNTITGEYQELVR